MLDITDEGVIDFIPYFDGENEVVITVDDGHRGIIRKDVRFIIT